MGYTHYWHVKPTTEEQFSKFVDVCKKLSENLPEHSNSAGEYYKDAPLEIAGWDGSGEPMFGKVKKDFPQWGRIVSFNGRTGNDDLSHETFLIQEKESKNDFCKTARKPYDLLVCACLIATHKILGYEVRSDGDVEDWMPAANYYNSVMEVKEPVENLLEFLNS